MATRKVKLVGTAEWAKVFEQNRDLTGYNDAYVEHDGACTIDLLMDEANYNAFVSTGTAKRPKKEGDVYRVKLVRKFNTGNDYSSGAPTVTHADGSTWDLDTDGAIGNGSVVEVIASVYDTTFNGRKGVSGTRLDSVKVLEHVGMEGNVPIISADTVSASSSPSVAKTKDEVLF